MGASPLDKNPLIGTGFRLQKNTFNMVRRTFQQAVRQTWQIILPIANKMLPVYGVPHNKVTPDARFHLQSD
jgi:hypothetical protein